MLQTETLLELPGRREAVVVHPDRHLKHVLVLTTTSFPSNTPEAWNVMSVATCDELLAIMLEGFIDGVVLDLDVHRGQVLHILSVLHTRFPAVPKLVLTACPASVERRRCLNSGAWAYLEKSSTVNEIDKVFAAMNELFDRQTEGGFHGTIRVTGLAELLQLECLHRRSSLLLFTSGYHSGRVFIEGGEIVHAELDEMQGAPALTLALALASGDFQLQRFQPPAVKTIDRRWELLLIEAAQKNDEDESSFFSEAAAAQ